MICSNRFLCFHLRGSEVEQDRSRGCICPVGGALDAEGLSGGMGQETVNHGTDEPTDRDAPTLRGFLCLP